MSISDDCLIFYFDENCEYHDCNSRVYARKIGLHAMNVKFEYQKCRCVQRRWKRLSDFVISEKSCAHFGGMVNKLFSRA